MGYLGKSDNSRILYLYDKLYRILMNEEIEISISVVINLLLLGLLTFAIDNRMDREQFILYVNRVLNEVKKELFDPERLNKLNELKDRE